MKSFYVALGFLTAVPVKTPPLTSGDLGRAGLFFPLIGLGLGIVLCVAQYFLVQLFSPVIAAALLVSMWAAVTGGLHLDGLADCADGFLASASPQRRLEIMRDPCVGGFGAVGLILFLLLKVHAVGDLPPVFASAALPASSGPLWSSLLAGAAPFVSATVLARWVVLVVALQPQARSTGWATAFALGLKPRVVIVAAVIPLAIIALGGWRTLAAALVAHLVALVIVLLARTRLGGVTGDVLGLTVEVVELGVILTLGVFSFQ